MKRNVKTNNLLVNNGLNSEPSSIMTCNKSINKSIANYYKIFYILIITLFFILLFLSLIPLTGSTLPPLPTVGHKPSKLNVCQRCKLLTESFEKGLERTSRGKYEGGDTHWEENKLGSYANSEIRLTEIQEQLCSDLSTGKDECHHLAEEYEPQIENWWFSRRQSQKQSLHDYLCLDQMKACCREGHFGPDCKPCTGFPDNVCNGRGYCAGNGSRDGTGKCICDSGFAGLECNKCGKKFYELKNGTDNKQNCQPCDKACQDACRSGGPKGCLVCNSGYIWDNDYGCVDIDECLDIGVNPCESNAFCINTEGSFYCYQCDKACDGCNGDGPDSCVKCAPNHALKDGICIDLNANKREMHISLARYATYLGLCVATCIIFRNNIYIASIIGVIVAVYITISEFTLKDDVFNPFSFWSPNFKSEI